MKTHRSYSCEKSPVSTGASDFPSRCRLSVKGNFATSTQCRYLSTKLSLLTCPKLSPNFPLSPKLINKYCFFKILTFQGQCPVVTRHPWPSFDHTLPLGCQAPDSQEAGPRRRYMSSLQAQGEGRFAMAVDSDNPSPPPRPGTSE